MTLKKASWLERWGWWCSESHSCYLPIWLSHLGPAEQVLCQRTKMREKKSSRTIQICLHLDVSEMWFDTSTTWIYIFTSCVVMHFHYINFGCYFRWRQLPWVYNLTGSLFPSLSKKEGQRLRLMAFDNYSPPTSDFKSWKIRCHSWIHMLFIPWRLALCTTYNRTGWPLCPFQPEIWLFALQYNYFHNLVRTVHHQRAVRLQGSKVWCQS